MSGCLGQFCIDNKAQEEMLTVQSSELKLRGKSRNTIKMVRLLGYSKISVILFWVLMGAFLRTSMEVKFTS